MAKPRRKKYHIYIYMVADPTDAVYSWDVEGGTDIHEIAGGFIRVGYTEYYSRKHTIQYIPLDRLENITIDEVR